jgi:glutamate-1-semialdehyde aminotransferase/3-oxoacyl-(acyl-carrier-protein) synthase/acyl carrier protein
MSEESSIAIVGMAGRFPGCADVGSFWVALAEGRETVTDYLDPELLQAGVDPVLLADGNYVKRGCHLSNIEYFDAAFFGYTGREAELMDPQQRIFLEICHEALEGSGHGPGTFDSAIGVYAGTRRSGYNDLLTGSQYDNVTDDFVKAGNEPDALATKVAYKLDCTGPALTVQTYCSTSLVAVHLACQQLLDGECDMALAGGIALRIPQHVGYLHRPGGTLSRDGRCRSFDIEANGLIFGDGAGVVVLRPLAEALADGDTVLAIIRGSAVTNDGALRAGYAAPGVAGQARAVREAMRAAGVTATDISYVETHGAGTPLGDSIEIKALSRAFDTGQRGYCAVGTVKPNVGHLDCAAGITGLIKTVLALRHRVIPPTLNFNVPNPEINLIDTPFFVSAESTPWEPISGRRIAGVSSLGIGGTNAHVIVEEAGMADSSPSAAIAHLFVWSAKSREALDLATQNLRRFLEDHAALNPADVAFSLRAGRRADPYRRMLIAADCAAAARALRRQEYTDGGRRGDTDPGDSPRPPGDTLEGLGRRWLRGETVDWTTLYAGEARRRVPLPTHPMMRQRRWPAPSAAGEPGTPNTTRQEHIVDALLQELIAIVADRFKMQPGELDPEVPFLELGADSMVLLSILPALEGRYGCPLSLRQFFGEFQTLSDLAGYLREHAVPERLAAAGPTVTVPAASEAAPKVAAADASSVPAAQALPADVPARGVPASALERLAMEQLRIMQRQLELMASGGPSIAIDPSLAVAPDGPPAAHAVRSSAQSVTASDVPRVPLAPGKRTAAAGPAESARRARYLQTLISRYNARTRGSKEFAQRFRPLVADSRSTIGFRLSTKEMLYPIVSERGAGARLWDIDGNEYVDLTLGFGVHLFGHNPPMVMAALRERMESGFGLGPRTELVERVAGSICELTGMERVAFVNTGSEAVITALRLARAATGRDDIVIFSTAYHGHSDGVLAAPSYEDGVLRTKPLATGIPARAVENAHVLEFGTAAALDYIARHGAELAAVMTEPVTTRHPGEQDPDFLRKLREVTKAHGVKLIFDEMVTGFRCHPGGIQGLFDIEADLVTYGKIIGGGLPLGVIGGRGSVMDAIDGGVWNFGDDSYPGVESTYFGGTFNQHPLSMVAANVVLDHLRAEGPRLQRELDRKTEEFVNLLNADFRELEAPIEIHRFSSLFRFEHDANMDLFYYNMLDRGVFIWEWRNCFLSTSHEQADLDHVRRAVHESIAEMREAGVLAGPRSGRNGSAGFVSTPRKQLPATLAQKQLWALAEIDDGGSLAYQLCAGLWLDGQLDDAALQSAVRGLVSRHEALRTTFSSEGESLIVRDPGQIPLSDLLVEQSCPTEQDVQAFLRDQTERPFDLEDGPVFRVAVARVSPRRHLLLIVVHHAVADGWSITVILGDLIAMYNAACRGVSPALPPAAQFRDFLAWHDKAASDPVTATHRDYWHSLLDGAPEATLPAPGAVGTPPYPAARQSIYLDAELSGQIRKAASARGVTVFAYLVSAWGALLHRLTGQDDIVLPVASAQRPPDLNEVVGYCTNLLPLRLRRRSDTAVADYLTEVQGQLLDALEHQAYQFSDLMSELTPTGTTLRSGLLTTSITLDRQLPLPAMDGLRVSEAAPVPISYLGYPIAVNIGENADGFRCDFDIAHDVLPAGLAERLPRRYRNLLSAMAADGKRLLAELDSLDADDHERLRPAP